MDELVARLDYLDLVEALKPEQMAGITAKNVDAVRIRCEALPDRVAGRLFKGPGKSPEPEADPASPKTIAKPRPSVSCASPALAKRRTRTPSRSPRSDRTSLTWRWLLVRPGLTRGAREATCPFPPKRGRTVESQTTKGAI
jgi:hypothetical protein